MRTLAGKLQFNNVSVDFFQNYSFSFQKVFFSLSWMEENSLSSGKCLSKGFGNQTETGEALVPIQNKMTSSMTLLKFIFLICQLLGLDLNAFSSFKPSLACPWFIYIIYTVLNSISYLIVPSMALSLDRRLCLICSFWSIKQCHNEHCLSENIHSSPLRSKTTGSEDLEAF